MISTLIANMVLGVKAESSYCPAIRNEQQCLNNHCAWYQQCQAAPSYCTDKSYDDCLSSSGGGGDCVWVGNDRYNGYCERDTDCGQQICESDCLANPQCEYAEYCGSYDEKNALLGAQQSQCAQTDDDRRREIYHGCNQFTTSYQCNVHVGVEGRPCKWSGNTSKVGTCQEEEATTTPVPPTTCGLFFARDSCPSDECHWNGYECVEGPDGPVTCGMFFTQSACPQGCVWTGHQCIEAPIECGLLYTPDACEPQAACYWNYYVHTCKNNY